MLFRLSSDVRNLPRQVLNMSNCLLYFAGLKSLNLGMISRETLPKAESQLKQEKLAKYEVLCSEVSPGVCISGEKVAGNRALLKSSGITHIINCVGMLVPNYFESDFTYFTLYLRGGSFLQCSISNVQALEPYTKTSSGLLPLQNLPKQRTGGLQQ